MFNRYKITVKPSVITTDEKQLLDYPEDKTKCRFSSQTKNSSIFSSYSRSGCLYECKLRQAYDRIGCVPWDYPQPNPDNISHCHDRGFYYSHFHKSYESASTVDCDCPPDCNSIAYDVSLLKETDDASHRFYMFSQTFSYLRINRNVSNLRTTCTTPA